MVQAEPDANALLRVLEPFVIHDVTPHRIEVAAPRGGEEGVLQIDLFFSAAADLATRIEARLATMVTVRTAQLLPLPHMVDVAA